jgi:hypothetical protein
MTHAAKDWGTRYRVKKQKKYKGIAGRRSAAILGDKNDPVSQ